MPKVSVIIVTHNRAKFLPTAIMSVLDQTFRDFELVIVDDASQDETQTVASSFQDERIKYIRQANNTGPAGARNTGVLNANSEYIAFLDDDDEWLPEKLALQVNLLESSPPEIGIVYTGHLLIDGGSQSGVRTYMPEKRGDLYQELRKRNIITLSSVLMRKQCFERIGLFDVNIAAGSDYDMWIRLAEAYHFECITMPLVKYLLHQNSISSNNNLGVSGRETMLRKHEKFFSVDKAGFSRRHFRLGIACYLKGDIQKGRIYCLQAIRIYPLRMRYYYILICLSLFGAKGYKKLLDVKTELAQFSIYCKA